MMSLTNLLVVLLLVLGLTQAAVGRSKAIPTQTFSFVSMQQMNLAKTFLFIVFLSGCLQPVEILTDPKGEYIVISGQLSNLTDQSILYVGATAESERLPYPISGAIVNLFEADELVGAYAEDQAIPGKYVLNDKAGVPGKTYHVQVILPDNRVYESIPEKMPADAGSVSSYYEFAREETVNDIGSLVMQNFIKVFANSTLPEPSTRFIRWLVEEVYIIVPYTPPTAPFTYPPCFVTQAADPQFIVQLDRQHLTATGVPDQFLGRRLVDETFTYQHYFVTYQSAITKEAYDYWSKVKVLVNGNGSIFDTPPAKIFGNIRRTPEGSEKVFGYFQTANQAVSRISITKDDFPFGLNFSDCQGNGPQPFPLPSRCVNCLSVRNSSHVRPPWF